MLGCIHTNNKKSYKNNTAYDISLWDGHVAFYSLKRHNLLVIGDNHWADSLQSMYDLLWTMSENITPKRLLRAQLRKGIARHRGQT